MSQVVVFSGAERRRRWSFEEKRALVAQAFAPGAVVAEVARGADLQAGQIYRWRQELRGRGSSGGPAFAEVVVGSAPPSPEVLAAIVIELGAGVKVRIGASASPTLVTAALRALSK